MSSYQFQDSALAVTVEPGDQELSVSLRDLTSGKRWGPVPLARLWVHCRGEQRTDLYTSYQLHQVDELADGLRISIGRNDHRIDLTLWLQLADGELLIRLCPGEIYERFSSYYLLFRVDLLPGLLTTGPASQVLLPLGQGVTFSPQGKPALDDRFLLYLEQERWELVPSLPICAALDTDGGLIWLAGQGAADTECHVTTDGHGTASVGFNISLRQHWPDPVDPQLRELRIAPLAANTQLVMSCAKRLRRHAMEDHHKPLLTERIEEDEGLAYTAQAYTMKLFHGIEHEGLIFGNRPNTSAQSYHNCMTFAEAGTCLKRLHDAGVDKVYTQSVGWNIRGHDGLYPTRFPVDPRIGGEAGFRDLVRLGRQLGYQINVHDNFMMNVPHAPDWNPDYLTHDRYGEPLVSGWWSGGVEYQTWGLALPNERFDDHFASMRDIGISGTYYVDYMAQPLEVNYHPRHKGGRGDCQRGQERIFRETCQAWGSVGTELAVFYAAIACDYVTASGHRAGNRPWAVCKLIDNDVPLWDLTFHGLTLHERQGLHHWPNLVKAAIFTHHPRDEWSMRTPPMPILTDTRVAGIKAVYDLIFGQLGHLKLQLIDGWQRHGDEESVTYADGTIMAANHATGELTIDGTPIPRPEALADNP